MSFEVIFKSIFIFIRIYYANSKEAEFTKLQTLNQIIKEPDLVLPLLDAYCIENNDWSTIYNNLKERKMENITMCDVTTELMKIGEKKAEKKLAEKFAEKKKLIAEQDKLIAEQDKLIAEKDKLMAEQREEIDRLKALLAQCNKN